MAASPGHDIVARTAFELIGVALLAILADSNKSVGNIVVVFMVAVAFIWAMTKGASFLNPILSHFQTSAKPGPRPAVPPGGKFV